MKMLSVMRYTAARCAPSQIWAPAWLLALLAIAIAYPPATPAVGSLDIGALLLLPVSAWLAFVTLSTEPGPQAAMLAAAHGGVVRHRMAILASASLAALALVPFSAAYALWHNTGALSGTGLAVAVLAQVVSVLVGVSIGCVVARPLIARTGYALAVAALAVVAFIAVPHLPPLRPLVERTEGSAPGVGDLLAAVAVTAATLAGAVLVWWASGVLARRRT
jgi:hypothetical protein